MILIKIKVDQKTVNKLLKGINGSGVYCFKSDNDYLYIGKSVDLLKRLYTHRAWIKHLIDFYNMNEIIIVYCDDKDKMHSLEKESIDFHKPIMNIMSNECNLVDVNLKLPKRLAEKFNRISSKINEELFIDDFNLILQKQFRYIDFEFDRMKDDKIAV